MLQKPNVYKKYADSRNDYYAKALEIGSAERGILSLRESMRGAFGRAVKTLLTMSSQYPSGWEDREADCVGKNVAETRCLFEGLKVNGADMALAFLELGIPARVFEPGAVYSGLTLVAVRKSDFGVLKLKLGM